jgi:hypothetical protein
MSWIILFHNGGMLQTRWANSLPEAVKEACKLLDLGAHVREIQNGAGARELDADAIERICARLRARRARTDSLRVHPAD